MNSKIKLHVFYCSNSYSADDLGEIFNDPDSAVHKFISLPCSGKAGLLYILKSFETGADGMIILTCPRNECRYLEGNLRAPRRAAEVDSILAESGMEGGRILVLSPESGDIAGIRPAIGEFTGKIRSMSARGVCA